MIEFFRLPRWLFFTLAPASLAVVALGATATTPLSPTPTEAYTWRDVAIGGGGFVSGVLFHPTEPGLCYARTDVGGVFRRDAAHPRWTALNDDLGREKSELLGVLSFAVDPLAPERLYLACGSYLQHWAKPAALLWSTDRGTTWQHVPLPFKLGGNADGRSAGERLQVDPYDGRVLLLGTNQDGLWRSRDHGLTWHRLKKFPAPKLTFVLFDPRRGQAGKPTAVIYAGAYDLKNPALYQSTNGGESWAAVPRQPVGLLIQRAEFDAEGTLYLSYANGLGPNDTSFGAVWKYSPDTAAWTDITPLVPNPAKNDGFSYAGLAVDQKSPGTLLVATLDRWARGDEIFRSIDRGKTWRPIVATSAWDSSSAPYIKNFKPHWIGGIALDPFNSNHTTFITGYGLWTTTHASAVDTGENTPWHFDCAGLEETVIDALASPPVGAPLLSAIADIGGFRHDDLDKSPAAGTHQPTYGGNPSLDFAEQIPLKVVRTHHGSARGALSLDGGTTWKDFATAPPAAKSIGPGAIAISADGRRLVWLPKGSAPYFSTDDGLTWTPSRAQFRAVADYRISFPIADRVAPAQFYAYDDHTGQFHVSTDGGENFSATIELPKNSGRLCAEPDRAGHLWLPTPKGLFFSTDAGQHFRPLRGVEAAYQVGFGRAAPGKSASAIYLAGRVDRTDGIFRSDDGGTSWIKINPAQAQWGWIRVITGDPRIHGRVYLGTSSRGIFYGEPAKR